MTDLTSTSPNLTGFTELLPERIFTFAERFGGVATGRFLGLNALENRVYEVELEYDDGSEESGRMEKRIVKFYRPGRWSRASPLEAAWGPRPSECAPAAQGAPER